MIIHILITVGFYFILMFLSATLLGLFVRGLFTNPEFERIKKEGHEFLKKVVEKSERAGKWVNLTALVLIVIFFYLLFRIWNVGVVIASIIIMLGRWPDLLWEIKHGRKVDLKLMERNVQYYLTSLLPWLALPVLYYSLYLL